MFNIMFITLYYNSQHEHFECSLYLQQFEKSVGFIESYTASFFSSKPKEYNNVQNITYFLLLSDGVRLYTHSRNSIEIRGYIFSIYNCIHELTIIF